MHDSYDDIIHLPHPTSKVHPRMSRDKRAAQFSPFAALTGFEGAVMEAGRLTEEKLSLSDNQKELLDQRIQWLMHHPEAVVEIQYFIPDPWKEGGMYEVVTGKISKIHTFERSVLLEDGSLIRIDDIRSIQIVETVRSQASFQD